MELTFDRVLGIIGIVLAIVLVVLDKAGKLKGPVLLIFLGLAALMTLPLALGNSWVKDSSWGMLRFSKSIFTVSIVAICYSIFAIWISPSNENSTVLENGPPRPHPPFPPRIADGKIPHEITKAPPKEQPPQTIIQTQAPYGNLAARCDKLGAEIIAVAESRNKARPDPTRRDAYKDWYRLNDGLFFHGPFYRRIAKIHQELSDLHIDDPQLDELIERHERYYAARQSNVQVAIDFPEALHLSIEEIREIGERFRTLATQVPKS